MRIGINHVDKLDFLEAYPSARIEAFKSETIKNSFAAAGLVPYDPDRVLSKLRYSPSNPDTPLEPGKRVVAENAFELRPITKVSILD